MCTALGADGPAAKRWAVCRGMQKPVTIINSMGVYGRVVDTPVYHPYVNRNGLWLDVGVTFSRDLWPWTGHLALHLAVRDAPDAAFFDGIAEGYVSLKVESIESSTKTTLSTELKLPIRVKIAPTPKRQRRILIDYFHNIRYPSAYVPGDDLTKISGPLDWYVPQCLPFGLHRSSRCAVPPDPSQRPLYPSSSLCLQLQCLLVVLGDHIHTNLRGLYQPLRQLGYFVEVLQKPLTCFNASNYGTLMIIDPEDEFAPNEIKKVHTDVHKRGLSLVVFAGWFNASVQEALKFYDANTNRRQSVPLFTSCPSTTRDRLLVHPCVRTTPSTGFIRLTIQTLAAWLCYPSNDCASSFLTNLLHLRGGGDPDVTSPHQPVQITGSPDPMSDATHDLPALLQDKDETSRLWVPITGGSNIPALNDLLSPFAIKFADNIVGGSFKVGDFYDDNPQGQKH
ncbi:unnamed protein product [Mesocestoides corti]|uniref:Uncharacterized protein n=1 Tax=Mesocestoides corti TaxID=53468 RepID=A0A158QV07_MESCO|nr:unnamed protein product [Mesocestoides corti]